MMPPKKQITSADTLISIGEERAALGAALLEACQAGELIHGANVDDFAYPPHCLIFESMRAAVGSVVA